MHQLVKRSVAVVISDSQAPGSLLAVRRPFDGVDEELPGVWGLPASTREPNESWSEAVIRTGREKLGVELAVGDPLHEGVDHRSSYILEMLLVKASIVAGAPRVLQSSTGVTQYIDWKWADASILIPGASKGSLCCRLYLDSEEPGTL